MARRSRGCHRAGAADSVPLWAGAAALAHLHLEVQMSVLHFTEVGVQAQSGGVTLSLVPSNS